MGLFSRGQVGAANTPEAHTTAQAPKQALALEQGVQPDFGFVDEYGIVPVTRAFRAVSVRQSAVADASQLDTFNDELGLDADQNRDRHLSRGARNLRQTDEVERGNARGELGHEVAAERFANDRTALVLDHVEAAPQRPRLGWTGEDPARTMTQRRPIFMRPFDQGISQHPFSGVRVDQAAPNARTSRDVDDLPAGARPYAGGWFGTKRAGMAIQRQNVRRQPPSWGSTLVNDPAAIQQPRNQFRGR